MKMSENISELAKALAQAQKELKNPENTADNPFFKSKYAPLDAVLNLVRPVLAKHGLSIIQRPVSEEKQVGVETMLLHESGQYLMGEPYLLTPAKLDPQSAGGAITYARRYALSAMLGICGEDDSDGNREPPVISGLEPIACSECGKAVTGSTSKGGRPVSAEKVREISMKKYGRPICAGCMEAMKDAGHG